jgi:hypothetical protein
MVTNVAFDADVNRNEASLVLIEETSVEQPADKKEKILQKLKSLNLPVTVSLSDNPVPRPKLKESLPETGVPTEKPPRIGVAKKAKKNRDAIELTGKTVTNRCSWCGSVFHRLYLFLDHLKVFVKTIN